jgi:hypothetical protein
MPKDIIPTGDPFAEKGTTAWADWQRCRMRHALQDAPGEARQIVPVIREMCASPTPAWQLMTRRGGIGFRSFAEFVTSPEGLAFPDYTRFWSLAVREPGFRSERAFGERTACGPLYRLTTLGQVKESIGRLSPADRAELRRWLNGQEGLRGP